MEGLRFGSLIGTPESITVGKTVYWWFICDCGSRRRIDGKNVRSGKSTSCGCARVGPKPGRLRERTSTPKPRIKKVKEVKEETVIEAPVASDSNFKSRFDLAVSMRRTWVKWSEVEECCGEDVVLALKEASK